MAKNKDRSKSTDSSEDKSNGKGASAGTKSSATQNVVAHPRLVAAMKTYQTSLDQSQSYLVTIAEIVQNEQLTRAEVVASIMEARGVEKSTAESQYSRMVNILTKPEVLEELRSGDIDLKTARTKGVKKQENPSQKKKDENREKKFTQSVTKIVECAKEGGMDIQTVMNTIKSALKKAGVK